MFKPPSIRRYPQHIQELRHRGRHVRSEQNAADAEGFGAEVDDALDFFCLLWVFCQVPWLGVLEVLVCLHLSVNTHYARVWRSLPGKLYS